MRDMRGQEAAEYAAVIADLQMKEFVHDDVVLEGMWLREQVGSERAPPAH